MLSKFKSVLFNDNMIITYLYFYVHFALELICYYVLYSISNDVFLLWIIPLIYDAVAFLPQALIGYTCDKYPKINIGIIGVLLLIIGIIIFYTFSLNYLSIIILSLGNACLHISGAENVLNSSNGKLTNSAIFVAGGSFGIIIGRLLSKTFLPWWIVIIFSVTLIPFILLAPYYKQKVNYKNFNYNSSNIKKESVIILAFISIIIRGYISYGIPMSWNKTLLQTCYLYIFIGIGKMLGGIFADLWGVRRTAIISTVIGLPFILFGNKYMIISLIGVVIFNMTMPITLGVIASVLKNNLGLAFGITTIGLFLGILPTFFFEFITEKMNNMVIIIFTIVCLFNFLIILRKENDV